MINLTLIKPDIFIGTFPQNEVDIDRLRSGPKITAVLNLQTNDDFIALGVNWPKIEQAYLDRDMMCQRWPIIDFSPEDLEKQLEGAAAVLDQLIGVGHRVYVHCTAGVGRAPAVVIGYLAWHQGLGVDEAHRIVKGLRACNPYMEAVRVVDAQRKSL